MTDLALIDRDPVEAHGREHHLVPGLEVGVDADPEQRLAVVLAPVAHTPELGPGAPRPAPASLPLSPGFCTRFPEIISYLICLALEIKRYDGKHAL